MIEQAILKNIMNYDLVLEFAFYHTNGKMRLFCDDQEIIPVKGKGKIHKKINLPTSLWLKVSGKNEDKDTRLKDGEIIKDRHIRLINVSIDGIRPPTNFIRRWPLLHVGGRNRNQKIYSHYWGFNGEIELEFNGQDKMTWLLGTNLFRDNSWHANLDHV